MTARKPNGYIARRALVVSPPPLAGARFVPLSGGYFAIVSVRDYGRVSQYTWSYGCRGYAVGTINGRLCYMHKFILNAGEGLEVDHKNRNSLDNRRGNLRKATHAENLRNTKLRSDNSSGLRGVSFDKARGVWAVYLTVNGHRRYLGRFERLADAAKAYATASRKWHRHFAGSLS